jgi:hypothetical protein
MLLMLSWAREKVETAILALVWMMVMYWSGCMPGKVCMGCGGHEQCPKRRHFSRKNGQLEISFQVTRLVRGDPRIEPLRLRPHPT